MTNNNRSRRGLGRSFAVGVMATILVLALPLSAMAVHLTGVTQLEPVGDDDNVGVALAWSNPAGFPNGGLASGARDPEYVLIGRDDIFPDNLASGALQGAPGPLLLTPTDELDDRVIDEIERLGVDRAIILGETNAISQDVEDALGDEVGTVDRFGGATRIETAIEVTRESGATTVLLARAFDADGGSTSAAFADSLAGGGWAAAEGFGVLLTQTETLTQSTADFLSEGDVDQVIILGGNAAVSAETEAAVAAIVADTTRVFGDNRAGTAVEIAEARGYPTAGSAPGNILIEGFVEDAWASGFAAAATSALEDYPIVLANGDDLPPETEAYATGTTTASFAQANPDSNVVCGPRTSEEACLEFAALVGTVDLTVDSTSLAAGDDLTGSVNVSDDDFDVTVSGCGFTDEPVTINEDGTFTIPDFPGTADDDGDDDTDDTTCVLTFTFTNEDGDTFTRTATITITTAPVTDNSGVIVAFDIVANTYTFVADDGSGEQTVTYDEADDTFTVDGTPATPGAFEAALSAGDRITVTDNDDDSATHALVNAAPAEEGVIGNVDTGLNTFDIIEPVSGAAIGGPIDYTTGTDCDLYEVDGTAAQLATFENAINEGDTFETSQDAALVDTCSLTNAVVAGDATRGAVAAGVTTQFQVDNLGDDFSGAQDDFFVADAAAVTAGDQTISIDGTPATYLEFEAELSDGDQITYARNNGIEAITLVNAAPNTVSGQAVDDLDIALDTFTIATDSGDEAVDYTAIAPARPTRFIVDGVLATEADFEADYTAGDAVSFTPDDAAGGTGPVVTLTNQDLAGSLADVDANNVAPPADAQVDDNDSTLDVIAANGTTILVDELDYTLAFFGGTPRYFVDGAEVALAVFEDALEAIDEADTEDDATLTVVATALATEYRLTTPA